MTPCTDTCKQLIELMGDKRWNELQLAAALNKPVYGIRSTLRGMQKRKEVTVIQPKVRPGLFEYQITQKARSK